MHKSRGVRALAVLVLVTGAIGGMLALSGAQAATTLFVQGRAKEITSGTTNSLAFSSANTAGNLIVVYVVWGNTGSVTLSDSNGNSYAPAAPARAWGNGNAWRSQVFYAKSIAGGANTVSATFGSSITSFGAIYIHEYSGLDRTSPLDTTASDVGTARAMNSGSATTTNANDLIFGAGASNHVVTAAGTGFTSRLTDLGNRTEDRNVTSTGSYNATATQDGSRWVMHMVAFKAAAGGDTAPTTPTGLTATAASSSAVNLSWTPSTDDVGVAGYKVFRNGTQVATTTAPSYQDTGLSEATSYSYTVSAFDAAGNESPRSSVATATTRDVTAPSVPAGLAANPVSSSRVDLSWSASTDNVGVANYRVFRDGTEIATPTGTSYQDTGLTSGSTYSYRVSAVDAANNGSALSTAVSATTPAPDTAPPSASVTAPAAGSVVSGSVNITATANDNVGVVGVQFLLDGQPLGAEDTSAPYGITWDTTTASNGLHILSVRARDAAGNTATSSSSRTVTVSNTAPPPTAGMVAGWSFNEGQGQTAQDSSGKGNAAALHGGTWTPGKYGGGLRLNGANEYLSAPNSPSLNISGSGMTLSMWLNPEGSTGGDHVVFGKFWGATMSSPFYQYGLELDGGTVPHFYVGSAAGATHASMGSALPVGQWTHLAVTLASGQARFYVNGNLTATASLASTITARDSLLYMGADIRPSQFFRGSLDDVRLYNRAQTGLEVLNDMNTSLSSPGPDPTAPNVSITAPTGGAVVSGNRTITADATDDVAVTGVQFYVDGIAQGPEDTAAPYAAQWDTRQIGNGAHTLTARARDGDGHTTLSPAVEVTVANGDSFQNQVLATGFDLPTNIEFLPDGRMLVGELAGKIKVLPPPYTTPDPTPFLQLTNVGSAGVQQGLYDMVLDPNFTTNHYYYVFYTIGTPNVDRVSRLTANAGLTGTIPGSELVLYQDPQTADAEHHGGALNFGNDGMLYFTTGDHFQGTPSQNLNSPRGKVHRIFPDGLVPTDNPFYDGNGPHWDSVWAYGLRNPFRAYYDPPSGRLYIGDVGGNTQSTAKEELNLGARAANYGWPDSEGPCSAPCTSPLYTYAHNGVNAAITGGFVYHGSQFPASMRGNYFFADYAQHWIKRMTFDANGNVSSVNNFEPLSGSPTESAGDVVYLTEGPDGAIYYVDLGYSDISATFGVSKIRRIRYLQSNQAPVALVSANPTSGPAPLNVTFSSAGSMDPEGQPITYSWDFGDGTSSTAANPTHVYTQSGQYLVRLTVSDGVNSSLSTPLTISVGTPPTATINSPTDGVLFRAGDVITYSGDATDQEDGTLPASAYTWNIDFLHDNHVHPGTAISGVKSGSFTIPSSGHDFEGNTRYRITLTVSDSNGLRTTKSVTIFPDKVNLALQHLTGRFDTSRRRRRAYDTVLARHARRVQPHDRGARPGLRQQQLRLQLVVRRRCQEPHNHGAELAAVVHGDLRAGGAAVRAGGRLGLQRGGRDDRGGRLR